MYASQAMPNIESTSVYNLRFELNFAIQTSSLIFNLSEYNSTCPRSTTMNGLSHRGIFLLKFQLVHLGKLAKNQLARSQNPLVTEERTSVKIFTATCIYTPRITTNYVPSSHRLPSFPVPGSLPVPVDPWSRPGSRHHSQSTTTWQLECV